MFDVTGKGKGAVARLVARVRGKEDSDLSAAACAYCRACAEERAEPGTCAACGVRVCEQGCACHAGAR